MQTASIDVQRARRSAIRAKTSRGCISCMAYGKRCDNRRPCSSCMKHSKACIPIYPVIDAPITFGAGSETRKHCPIDFGRGKGIMADAMRRNSNIFPQKNSRSPDLQDISVYKLDSFQEEALFCNMNEIRAADRTDMEQDQDQSSKSDLPSKTPGEEYLHSAHRITIHNLVLD